MRFTLRSKLLTIVAMAAAAFVSIIVASAALAHRTAGEVERIQNDYVPRVQLEPRLEGAFERLQRGFQDAAASGDLDTLDRTHALRAAVLQIVDAAGSSIEPSERAKLSGALDDYYAAAFDVSRRLIAAESGERLVDDIASMQRKQARVVTTIKETTAFDEHELTAALASVRDAGTGALRYQVSISIGCLVAVVFFSIWRGRRVVRGLSELTAGFERFGRGDFAQPLRMGGRDELDDVAHLANQMAANLERLDRENRLAEAALKAANRELEAFSYSVAHDLRAPLRAISGFAEILAETQGEKVDEEGRDCIETIVKNADKMGRLIDALLSLARVSRQEVHARQVNLSEIAREELAQLAAGDPARSVEVVIREGVEGKADPALARALLQNLLGNAWKFTAKTPNARVEFGTVEKAGARAFFVRDNGAGFDMAYAEKLFGAFQRLHTEAEFTGTGIGLATVQRIVLRHRGRIWAEGAVGAGATFYFTLSPD